MTASETVEAIVKLGMMVSDANGGKFTDWKAFLASPEYKNIADSITKLLSSINTQAGSGDLDTTIQALSDKQQALLGGKTLAEMPTDKLIQYGELGNVKVVLNANKVAKAMNADFASWLVDDALPVLLKAAPVVIPLLL
jgi:hypothetical protein